MRKRGSGNSSTADASAEQWLRQHAGGARAPLTIAVAVGLAGGWLLIVQAALLAHVVSAVTFGGRPLATVLPALAAMAAIFVLRALIAWGVERASFAAAARVKLAVRRRLVEHVHALGPARLEAFPSGELANTITDGVEALEAYFARYLPHIALAALVPLSIVAVVLPIDWISGLILLGTAPLIPLFMVLIGREAESLNQRQWRRLSRLSAYFLDALQGLTTLKLFNASTREAAIVGRLSEDYRKSTLAVLRIAFLSSLVLEFLATMSIAMVAVLVGFRLLWGDLGFEQGFLALLLAPEFYLPLRSMGTHYHARMQAIGAAERVLAVLALQVPRARATARLAPVRSVELCCTELGFAYAAGREALRALTFDVHAGQRVAIVGRSGAGKSTLMKLLLAFLQPSSGRILVNGVELGTLDRGQWLQHVAWVAQRPHLFAGSIRDNICLGRPDADPDRVRDAAQRAFADEFIERLPHGYDTLLGEQGYGLSGGQAQRIALARAFLKDAPLVLMDEPSANLDAESERRIAGAVERLARGRTLVTIAHRLGTVRTADRILVLEHGRLVEAGSHPDLLARGGPYAKLVRSYRGAA